MQHQWSGAECGVMTTSFTVPTFALAPFPIIPVQNRRPHFEPAPAFGATFCRKVEFRDATWGA